MTDQELEQRLRAWYAREVADTEAAPADLRETLATIPSTAPAPLRPLSGRRRISLLAVAAVLLVGGALAATVGSGTLRPVVTPVPNVAIVAPAVVPVTETPAPTPSIQPGRSIAFVRLVDKGRTCYAGKVPCASSRLFIVGTDGQSAHEVISDGDTRQADPAWSPDGRRLLYSDDGKLYMIDPSGGGPQPVDTGCTVPCVNDSQPAFSSDGASLVFIRTSTGAAGYIDAMAITTMDLESGRVARLESTALEGGRRPGWSPDRRQIVFSRLGGKLPDEPDGAVFIVDADGENLHQVSPVDLGAVDAAWSPDGSRIVFVSPNPYVGSEDPDVPPSFTTGDIYTMRPDGTDVRRLTTDRSSTAPAWTADGRILYTRVGSPASADPGWWIMDVDGTHATEFLAASAIGVTPGQIEPTRPAWQQVGGAAIVPLPWTPAQALTVGPPAPTPAPTATPNLAPGFAWTGAPTTDAASPLGDTATLLDDGRVLVTANCGTAAEVYDPATGTFSATGSMTATRAFAVATLLNDGHVLVTGGYNCAPAGHDGIWASAELYDPATGTFSPTGSMKSPRENHTATLLADGRVLIAGGLSGPSPTAGRGIVLASVQTAETASGVLAKAEVYDPATGTFSKTGSMTTFRDNHTATLLADGRVLVTGGGGEGYASSTSADVYDPSTGRFAKTGPMKTGRWLHTATLLHDGRVLILGGRSPQDSVYAKAETYDPRSGRFTSAGSMTEGRQQHTATLLPDGRVLIAGGYWSDGKSGHMLSSTETFDPATGNFGPTGSMGTPRDRHGAVRLHDGRVFIVGGEGTGDRSSFWTASAVLYQP